MTTPLQALPLDHRFLSSPSPNSMPSFARTLTGPYSHPVSKLSYATGGTWNLSPDAPLDRDTLFLKSYSRVLRFYDLPRYPSVFLSNLFLNTAQEANHPVPIPRSLWTRQADYAGARFCEGIWAYFGTHEEACSALAIFRASISVSPALESDLEPLHSVRRLQFRSAGPLPSTSMETPIAANGPPSARGFTIPTGSLLPPHSMSSSRSHFPGLSSSGFVLSSNPPNPRTVFRQGDWMCPSTSCAAHNFGRNFSCIGCGCPRPSATHAPSSKATYLPAVNSTQVPSPRFVAALEPQMPVSPPQRAPHILTPSGRAFGVGGRVQNVSSDPLLPCIVFWPDNEPFPEQSQIRPNLLGYPHPPILNTGNRGPIEHQPGDWICQKCNYLNWRRRKVCQTCYPYAEGNGDSIPAAVQADRIKRLREALAVTLPPSLSNPHTASLDITPQSPVAHIQRPHCRYIDPRGPRTMCSPALKSRNQIRSSMELGFHSKDTIYQTSTTPASLSYYPEPPSLLQFDNGSGPFLPSCLQDIVQSPSLSPTSTVSADLSVDEYVTTPASAYSTIGAKHYPNNERPLHVRRTTSSVSLGGNIWQLDGEESKALSGSLASPNEVPRV